MFDLFKWWRKYEDKIETKKPLFMENAAWINSGKSKGSQERKRQKRARMITRRYA